MSRGLIIVVAVAASLASAAPASAIESLTPNNRDFGNQTLGTEGPTASFTLTAKCTADPANPMMPTCLIIQPFSPSFSVGPDFRITEEDCPPTMPGDTIFGTSCTIRVAFRPTGLGVRESILETGSAFARAAVRGTGVAPPVQPAPATKKKKKCKKRKKGRAVSAGKCKRRAK